MLQLTELVTPWSFCLAIHQISSHRCCGCPIALTQIPWTMRCGACSSNASTITWFATSTTWNSFSSWSGVASTRTSLTEQFDSGVFDYAHVSAQTAATLSTNCNCCFVYELLRRLFHIGHFWFWVPFLKQLLLRNCTVDFVEICNVHVGKMIIKAAKRIFNCDKICCSYSELNFGVTFFGTQCTSWFGIQGSALDWFKSYLSSRSSGLNVLITSLPVIPVYVVSLKVRFFVLYYLSCTVSTLISSLSLNHYLYADDTQLFFSFYQSVFDSSITQLQHSLQQIQISSWITANLLTLNSSKPEFLLIGLPQQLAKINTSSLCAQPWYIFDEHLTFSDQISALSKSCCYHICELHCLRPYLDFKTTCTIATSIVHSKSDYCNSLYNHLPQS